MLHRSSPYRNLYRQAEEFAANMQKNQAGPEAVSRVVQQAIEARKPKARYLGAVPRAGRLVLRLGRFVLGFCAQAHVSNFGHNGE